MRLAYNFKPNAAADDVILEGSCEDVYARLADRQQGMIAGKAAIELIKAELYGDEIEKVLSYAIEWVIEGCGVYWSGSSPEDFTTDTSRAIRFSRKQDAERVHAWIIEEHIRLVTAVRRATF